MAALAGAEPTAEHPLPFEDLLLSFVIVARRVLEARIGATGTCLSPAAHAALERSLLQELSRICGQAFEVEFSAHRAVGHFDVVRLGLVGTSRQRWGIRGVTIIQPLQRRYEWTHLVLLVDGEQGQGRWGELDSRQ